MSIDTKPRLAIVPARGGSKRIKRKNIRHFNGVPIIIRTLETIKNSGLFGTIHVSTEDKEIFNLVESAGFPPGFLRPTELADDHTPVADVLIDVVNKTCSSNAFGSIALIFPTAVFLTSNILSKAMTKFESLPIGSEMVSVSQFPVPVEWCYRRSAGGELFAREPDKLMQRSQDLENSFYESGQFVFYDQVTIGSMIAGEKQTRLFGFEMEGHVVDIDTEADWRLAEKLLA